MNIPNGQHYFLSCKGNVKFMLGELFLRVQKSISGGGHMGDQESGWTQKQSQKFCHQNLLAPSNCLIPYPVDIKGA